MNIIYVTCSSLVLDDSLVQWSNGVASRFHQNAFAVADVNSRRGPDFKKQPLRCSFLIQESF